MCLYIGVDLRAAAESCRAAEDWHVVLRLRTPAHTPRLEGVPRQKQT